MVDDVKDLSIMSSNNLLALSGLSKLPVTKENPLKAGDYLCYMGDPDDIAQWALVKDFRETEIVVTFTVGDREVEGRWEPSGLGNGTLTRWVKATPALPTEAPKPIEISLVDRLKSIRGSERTLLDLMVQEASPIGQDNEILCQLVRENPYHLANMKWPSALGWGPELHNQGWYSAWVQHKDWEVHLRVKPWGAEQGALYEVALVKDKPTVRLAGSDSTEVPVSGAKGSIADRSSVQQEAELAAFGLVWKHVQLPWLSEYRRLRYLAETRANLFDLHRYHVSPSERPVILQRIKRLDAIMGVVCVPVDGCVSEDGHCFPHGYDLEGWKDWALNAEDHTFLKWVGLTK